VASEKVALAGVVIVVAPACGSGVEVVEACFSYRGDLWVVKVRSEERLKVIAGFMNVTGMDADAG